MKINWRRSIALTVAFVASNCCAIAMAQNPQNTNQQMQTRHVQAPAKKRALEKVEPSANVQTPEKIRTPEPNELGYGPQNWRLGDTWRIETTNLQTQGAGQSDVGSVRWVFVVESVEEFEGRAAFNVSIMTERRGAVDPEFHLWVDVETGELLGTRSSVVRFGERKTQTEVYVRSESATATFSSNSSVPLGLPIFPSADAMTAKGADDANLGSGTYASKRIDATAKGADDEVAPFARHIKQRVAPVAQTAKGDDGEVREGDLAIELELSSSLRVSEVWRRGEPWALYSNNGISESRLLAPGDADTNAGAR